MSTAQKVNSLAVFAHRTLGLLAVAFVAALVATTHTHGTVQLVAWIILTGSIIAAVTLLPISERLDTLHDALTVNAPKAPAPEHKGTPHLYLVR